MQNDERDPMEASDLDDLDRAILDYLKENRGTELPWGIATPAVVLAALEERGWDDPPVRETINNHMRMLEVAGHLENIYGKGMYAFVNDPRESDGE